MKRTVPGLATLTLALATIALPAVADPVVEEDNEGGSVRDAIGSTAWIEDAPEYPVEFGTPSGSLTAQDEIAFAEFHKEFPWVEAYASFGCETFHIDIRDDGGRSMHINCSEGSISPDDIGRIPSTAIAAAHGYPSAVAALESGAVVDREALNAEIRRGELPSSGGLS